MVTLGVTAAVLHVSRCGGRSDETAVEVEVDIGNSRERVDM